MIPQVALRISTSTESLVEARLVGPPSAVPPDASLYGPHCLRGRTLPASYPCVREDDRAIAGLRLRVVDPCYWTPEMPFLYDLQTTAKAAPTTVDSSADGRRLHQVGFQRLEVHRRNLRLEQRRYVLRGVAAQRVDDQTLAAARRCEAALWTPLPSLGVLDAASQQGVWLVIDLQGHEASWQQSLLGLTWQPCVAGVVLRESQLAALPDALRRPRRLLLWQVLTSGSPGNLHPEADAVVAAIRNGRAPLAMPIDRSVPCIAYGASPTSVDLAEARRQCDRLQADLAPQHDLAGYFIGQPAAVLPAEDP